MKPNYKNWLPQTWRIILGILTLMAQGGIYRRFIASRELAVGWKVWKIESQNKV